MRRLAAHGASPGSGEGEALILRPASRDVRYRIPATEHDAELARFATSVERSRRQLDVLRELVARTSGQDHGAIFDAQQLMLQDPMLLESVQRLVRTERINVEWALDLSFERLQELFDAVDDPYLRERSGDVADVIGRLRVNLREGHDGMGDLLPTRPGPFVLVADELSPSVAAQIDWTRLAGFVLATGSWTYHTAILARSLGVPGVLGLSDATTTIEPGCWVRVDGDRGEVIIDPPKTEAAAHGSRRGRSHEADSVEGGPAGPVETLDGRTIRLEANIERPEDIDSAKAYGAEGIGLYRSEYLLAGRPIESLTEDVQYDVYRRVVAQMRPGPVTIRTFDAGENDVWGGAPERTASSTRRGIHAIRLSLAHPERFRCQLRALLRAGAHGHLRIMFPFVSGLEELRAARHHMARATEELKTAGQSIMAVPVGAMIEIPAAALTVDLLARDADFFSIGTNDLVQHTVAADRADPTVSHLHDPFHPAVLRMIRLVQRVGRMHDLDVSVCGEMAAETRALALLIGLGVTEFSMRPSALPTARRVVRTLEFRDVRDAARAAMRGATGQEIRALFDACRRVHTEPGAPVA